MHRIFARFFPRPFGYCLPLSLALMLALPLSVQAVDIDRVGGLPAMQTAAPTGRIVVKLAAGSDLVMDSSGVVARPGARSSTLTRARELDDLIGRLVPGARLEKRIPTARIVPRKQALASQLPDLALYAHIDTRGLSHSELVKLAARLNDQPGIDLAFLEPVAVPAALGFDAFTGAVPAPTNEKNEPTLTTNDFTDMQGYLQDAPLGIGALAMRPVAGQRGAGITVIDIEGAWLWTHEDLPTPVANLGVHIDDLSWRNHGTAVMGEMRGSDNQYGVVGITPDLSVGSSSIGDIGPAAAMAAALEFLQPGDLILIELHAPGPNATGEGQFGYVPMEYWQDNFDVIRLATARGIIVCEAAGNGYQNLDGPEYLGLFDRQVRDSGAIMCGATAGGELHSADFSNNGQRVDLNGWGWFVTTTGYGDLEGLVEEEFYTQQFSGTSSASPIVTGAVASLQGMVRQLHGFDLDARLARDLLNATGTPMDYGTLIGTRPNLVDAFALAADVGEITGTVTELGSGLPVAGALVETAGGAFTMTDTQGRWRLPSRSGPVNLQFSSYYHATTDLTVTVVAGETTATETMLETLPLIDLNGTVFAEDLTPLEGVVVSCTNQPVTGAVSGPDGSFSVSQVPAGYVFQLRFDGLAGYGAQVLDVDTAGFTGPALLNPWLPLVSEDFEDGPGQFVASDGLWTHGTPPVAVTGGAFDGALCWGVGLDGDYGDDESGQLLSPVYDLSLVQALDYQLSFHFFSATEAGFDGVNLGVSNGGPFTLLEPLDGYPDPSLSGLGNVPGWSGDSGSWQGAVFNISDFVGGDFQFRLNWGSDAGVTAQGFYVDGIAFGTGGRVTPVPDSGPPAVAATRLRAWPNPFNPSVTLEYSLAQPGRLQIAVYDLRGRKVKTLLDAVVVQTQGSVPWDGRSETGQPAASGVYFVKATPDQGPAAVTRVVLSK